MPHPSDDVVLCVDFGSTFTKALLVDVREGTALAAASHPTTIDTDVLDGFDACLAVLAEEDVRAAGAPVLACSSAGGGLRIAVVGNEELVSSEAGRRVALSSGGKVVEVLSSGLDDARWSVLESSEPDVVLLVGGTDGGNAEVLLGDAAYIARAGCRLPVVVAGNVDVQQQVADLLGAAGTPYVLADNVVPRIGVLAPESARAAIREVFLSHVIGGKHLSSRTDFAAMVTGATPDVVLTGVELLARGLGPDEPGVGDVVVVDVGGATTDVHSVVELDPEDVGLSREVVATTPVTRTVEGDLGMRWSAVSTAEAAGRDDLLEAARALHADPAYVPDDAEGERVDEELAAAAVLVAMQRHAGRSKVVVSPEGRVVERTGKDLREVAVLVGSGGVLRSRPHEVAVARMLAPATGEIPGGWQLPRAPRVVVDSAYVLAAAGLLRAEHPRAALGLVRTLLGPARK